MRKALTKVALAAAVAGACTSSHAYLILEIAVVGGTVPTLTCNTLTGMNVLNTATCAAQGFAIINSEKVLYIGNVDNFVLDGTFGSSNSPGTPALALGNITNLTVTRNNSASTLSQLFVGLRAFDFTQPNGLIKDLTGSASETTQAPLGSLGTGTNTITTNFWADPDNLGAKLNNINCNFAVTTSNSCDAIPTFWNDPIASNAGFSLRMEQVFDLKAGTSLNTTASIAAHNLPEPLSLTLVGTALLGAAFASRRGSKKA